MTIELTRLPSGLTIVTDNMPHLETASLGVWVAAGSRDETPEENGISHFLEHMAFKGTNRRTARQISEEIESVGGDINAATGVETTAYYARVLKADVPLALEARPDAVEILHRKLVGKPAPGFSLPAVDGPAVALAAPNGPPNRFIMDRNLLRGFGEMQAGKANFRDWCRFAHGFFTDQNLMLAKRAGKG